MKFEVYEHKTQYYETDQMGIIHHANYLHWFEEARIDIMDQLTVKSLISKLTSQLTIAMQVMDGLSYLVKLLHAMKYID